MTRASLRWWGLTSTLFLIACAVVSTSRTVAGETRPASQIDARGKPLDVAQFTTTGALHRPKDLDQWVFLGASLGMGYNGAKFNANSPGQFQVVLMEPKAYRRFVAEGEYPDGSMFLLSFYETEQQLSINRSGFVQGELSNFEIHLIDRRRSTEGRIFYPFSKADTQAAALPAGNECVTCHVRHGAFNGTFAQFYPAIRDLIPEESLRKARGIAGASLEPPTSK